MQTPFKETPILYGKDARRFLQRMKEKRTETPEQRVVYLKDMVLLMMCDGDIDDRELALCKATAIALGFKHEVIDAMIMDIIEDIKRNHNF